MGVRQGCFYSEFVAWYPLIDPRDDHEGECHQYAELILAEVPAAATLLELGAGAGNNASFLKQRFVCTLSDLSPDMLAHSRAQNLGCRHEVGDMRTLDLGETFDAVLVHDAISHMNTRADLRAALQTTFRHTRPGGVAVVVPDCVRESFREWTDDAENDDGSGRALQYVVRVWDPDPTDDHTLTDYAFLFRDADGVHVGHTRHQEGLFSTETWLGLLREVGFEPRLEPRLLPEDEQDGPYARHLFVCRRP